MVRGNGLDNPGIHRKEQMMKKYIYAALAAMMILNGCEEYHPFYDGQAFCINDAMTGIVMENDGDHLYVPLQYDEPYVIECYGGEGKNYTVTVSDPACLDYSLEVGSVETPLFDWEVIPTRITLTPKMHGDLSLTVKDDDTGESIHMDVHIRDAYHAIPLDFAPGSIYEGIEAFAFSYGGTEDVLHFCKGSVFNYDVVPFAQGKYSFVISNGFLYFEMTFLADEEGRPSESGVETFKRYQVQKSWGLDDPAALLMYMNLSDLVVNTKELVIPDNYYYNFILVDVTDMELPLNEWVESYDWVDGEKVVYRDYFNINSAKLIPWRY